MSIAAVAPARNPQQRRHAVLSVWPPAIRPTLDPSTLVAAYHEHRRAAFGLAYQVLRDGSLAEDAVQDAFLKLWTGSTQFDPSRGSMRGLVLTIARNTAIDGVRKRARRDRTESAYCADATYVTEGPERASERAYEVQRVRDALLVLPVEQRRAIEMAYVAGLTRREIATATTVSAGTVKSRVRLGMRKLALTLGDVVRES